MSRLQCKGCNYKPSEHDTLQGYCMLCAVGKIKKTELLEAENDKLRAENKELKEWRKRWDAGAADRRWKALGGSW